MEDKTFRVDFDVTIDLAGALNIKADTPEEARMIAKRLIKQCFEKEYCDVELLINEDDENGEVVNVKEMGHTRALNITNTMALN